MFSQIKYKHFLFLLLVYITFTLLFGEGILMPLGSFSIPFPGRYQYFFWWQNWDVLLSLVAIPVLAKSNRAEKFFVRLEGLHLQLKEKTVMFAILLGFSLVVHFFVLLQMHLTDDESAYRFSAQLLAHGQMTAQSFPHREFFERVFMINDGRFFSQYYYGWPFLLAIGEFIRLPFLINSILFACTACLLYTLLESFTSNIWALTGTCFFSLSPLMLIGSASYLSQTSTTFLFVLFLTNYRIFSIENKRNSIGPLVLMALSGGAMLITRPYTAALLCAPFVVSIFILFAQKKTCLWSIIAFVLVGAAMCVFFFLINKILHGSILGSGYTHYLTSAESNKFVYSFWNPTPNQLSRDSIPPTFSLPPIANLLQVFVSSFTRLNYDGAMLPSPLLLVVAALFGFRIGKAYGVSFLLSIIGYSIWLDLGVDSFGPVHLSETVPLAILFFVSLLYHTTPQINKLLASLNVQTTQGSIAVGMSILLCAAVCYLPIRLLNVHIMAQNIRFPYEQAEARGINNAVIFSAPPIAAQNAIAPLRHFRFWRDNPSIDLSDEIIWVNDFGDVQNKKLRELFPDRTFYRMVWQNNEKSLLFNRIKDVSPRK